MLSTPLTPLIRGGRESIDYASFPYEGGQERVLTASAPHLQRGQERKYSTIDSLLIMMAMGVLCQLHHDKFPFHSPLMSFLIPPLIRFTNPPLIRGARGVSVSAPPL